MNTNDTMTREEFDNQIGGKPAQALDLIWGSIWAALALVSLICAFAAPDGLWPGMLGTAGFGWLAWRRLHDAYMRTALWRARDAGEITFAGEQTPPASAHDEPLSS